MVEDHGPTGGSQAAPPAGGWAAFKEFAADALRSCEPRRLAYNGLLALVVLGHLLATWPASLAVVTRDAVLGCFLLAVLANVCYSAAYAVDLFVHFSGVRGAWPRGRRLILGIGMAFAAVITHFISRAYFAPRTG